MAKESKSKLIVLVAFVVSFYTLLVVIMCCFFEIKLLYISIPKVSHCFTTNDLARKKVIQCCELWINKEPTQNIRKTKNRNNKNESEIQLTINVRICLYLFTLRFSLLAWWTRSVYVFLSIWFWLNFRNSNLFAKFTFIAIDSSRNNGKQFIKSTQKFGIVGRIEPYQKLFFLWTFHK